MIFTTKYSWQRHSQTIFAPVLSSYLPAKLDTKPYKLDPSIGTNYIHEQSLMTGQKLYEWALYEINLSIPELLLLKGTRAHLRINNNDVKAIPLEKNTPYKSYTRRPKNIL